MQSMEKLEAFLQKAKGQPPLISERGSMASWLGDIGDARQSHRIGEVIRRCGLELPQAARPEFIELNAEVASRALSYLLGQSLAYGKRKYKTTQAEKFKLMFEELGPSAQFWSNENFADFQDNHVPETCISHIREPILPNTFETGIIGFNDTTGFIIWRGEED